MNAIKILENDHQELIQVMDKLEKLLSSKNADCDASFQRFKELFNAHDAAEDEIIYPRFKEKEELHKLILKGYQAHHVVHVGILELRLLPYESETWAPKFAVIKDSILAHIEEEEKKIFPFASKLFSDAELDKIGQEVKKQRS